MKKGYEYDEFGNLEQSGDTGFLNDVTFTGSVSDMSTGLQYTNARHYNPKTGRFLSQDTYRGNPYDPWTQHLYSYCGNNPTNFTDQTGHESRVTYVDKNGVSHTVIVPNPEQGDNFKAYDPQERAKKKREENEKRDAEKKAIKAAETAGPANRWYFPEGGTVIDIANYTYEGPGTAYLAAGSKYTVTTISTYVPHDQLNTYRNEVYNKERQGRIAAYIAETVAGIVTTGGVGAILVLDGLVNFAADEGKGTIDSELFAKAEQNNTGILVYEVTKEPVPRIGSINYEKMVEWIDYPFISR